MNTYILIDLPYLEEPVFVITDDSIFIALIQESYAPFTKVGLNIKKMVSEKSIYLKVIKSDELRQISIFNHAKKLYVKPKELSRILFIFISHYARLKKDVFFMHGAVIYYNINGIILTGKSGAGKSTLSSFLHLDDNRILCATDDKALVDCNNFHIIPCGDGIHLREEGVNILNSYFGNINEQYIELYDYKRAKLELSNKKTLYLSAIVQIQRNEYLNDIFELETNEAINVILMNAFSTENINNNIENALKLLKKVKILKLMYTDLIKAKENIFKICEGKFI